MHSIFFDGPQDDAARRAALYNGDLFVYSPRESALALCDFAREMAEAAFAPHDPRDAQFHLPVEKYVDILARLKPEFINHPRAKTLIQALLAEVGCDLEKTYFDVPRLRSMTHGDYLRAGLAYQFHPHRDTWFSAPLGQLNWWLPVYELQPENAMAFHPQYWSTPVGNSSRDYNYAVWNREGRKLAAQQIKAETRKQPKAEEPISPEPQVRLISQVGSVIIFSAQQMHSTVDNTSGRTRFSIDFRTVHLDDLEAGAGALNVDSESTGTTLEDYLRGTDLAHLPPSLIARYDTPLIPA
ncbi:MAG TPA: hypothetical protein VN848_02510 [Gemmatimonadales bacterium]|nr:hypothetical protein [Gemmatimonadales bacterium]